MSEVIFVDFEKRAGESDEKPSKEPVKVHLTDPSTPERPLSAKLQRLQDLIEQGLYTPSVEDVAEAILGKSDLSLNEPEDK